MKPSLRGGANGSGYGRDWTFGHWTEGLYARFRSGLSSNQRLSLVSLHSCGYDLPPPRVGWGRRYHALVKDSWFAGLLSLIGVFAGLCLWGLTIAVSRGYLSGDGWSLSGNGALIVPFGIGPALVAGGWAGIILRMRAHPRWLRLGIGSALIGFALAGAGLLSLVVFGPQGRDAGSTGSLFFGFLLYGWLLGSAIIAALIPAPDPERRGPPFWSIAAMILLP